MSASDSKARASRSNYNPVTLEHSLSGGDDMPSASNSHPTPVEVQKMRSPYPKLGVSSRVPRTSTNTNTSTNARGLADKGSSAKASKSTCCATQAANFFAKRRQRGIMKDHGATFEDALDNQSSDADFQQVSARSAGVDSAKKTPWTASVAHKGKRTNIFSEDEDTDLDGFLVHDEDPANGTDSSRKKHARRQRTSGKRKKHRNSFLAPLKLNQPKMVMQSLETLGVKTLADLQQLDSSDFIELENELKSAGVVVGDRSKLKALARQQAGTPVAAAGLVKERGRIGSSSSDDSAEETSGTRPTRMNTQRCITLSSSDDPKDSDAQSVVGRSQPHRPTEMTASSSHKKFPPRRSLQNYSSSSNNESSNSDANAESATDTDDDENDGESQASADVDPKSYANTLSLEDAHDRLVHL